MNFEVVLHKSEQGFGIGVEAQPIEGRGDHLACFVITCDLDSEAAQQQLEVGDEVISIAGECAHTGTQKRMGKLSRAWLTK